MDVGATGTIAHVTAVIKCIILLFHILKDYVFKA